MPTHARKPLIKISPEARNIYGLMVKEMNNNGYLDLEACLEISVAGVEMEGGNEQMKKCMTELQEASLVFPLTDRAGWLVRFPVVKF